jgi:GTP cyclohydrolase IA
MKPTSLTAYADRQGHWLQEHLAPKGVGVVLEAEHLCMSMRGVQKFGARTITSALHWLVRDDARTRQEFAALTTRSEP